MTRDGNGGWVRTEDDLRQALATLESHAPSADTVLARVRGAAGGGAAPGGSSRIRRWRPSAAHWRWRRARLALALAAAAAAAGLVIALLPGSAPPRTVSVPVQTQLPRLAPGQAGLPSAASVGQAMLTAFQGVRGDIEYDVNLKAEMQIAHMHEKVDSLYSEVVKRLERIELVTERKS